MSEQQEEYKISTDKESPQPDQKQLSAYGIVNLKEYIKTPDGRSVLQIEGQMTVMEDKQVVGFRVSGHVSDNWCVVVKGINSEWIILGCQIRAITKIQPDWITSQEIYKVP